MNRPAIDRIIALGDSITRGYKVPEGWGWVEILSRTAKDRLGWPVEFFNAGGNGNTSREGLLRFDSDVLPYLPGTVLLEFGGNDAVNNAVRHVTPDEFYQNLQTMVKRTRSMGGDCIILTFPAILSHRHSTATDPYFQARGGIDTVVTAYRERSRKCAAEMGLPLLDLDNLIRSWIEREGSNTIIAPDGIHWTVRTNQLMAEAMLDLLESDLL